MSENYSSDLTLMKARKEHICEYCGELIRKGEKYWRQFVIYEGDAGTWKEHTECRAALIRGGMDCSGSDYWESPPRGNPRGLTVEEYRELPEKEESA
ncbi:MAG: hypothetical protein EOM03_16160 [Clostridia bacterium]|nr:hypothetical protein [Clostridia bacterium]